MLQASLKLLLCLISCLRFSVSYPGQSRIFGGTKAAIEEIPWQVSIHYYPVNRCGGAIINENTILTAAHCFYDVDTDPEAFTVRAGTNIRSNGGEIYEVERITSHPNFNISTYNFDIAIVKLKEKIEYTNKIQAIPLANTNDKLPVGEYGLASGFGQLTHHGEFPRILQKTYLEVLPQEACIEKYNEINHINENMFCAGGNGINDACGGDSGGPFAVNGVLVGVISHGIECGLVQYPGVFTRISTFRQWIEDNM